MSRSIKVLVPILLFAGVAFSSTRTDLKVGTRTAIVDKGLSVSNILVP